MRGSIPRRFLCEKNNRMLLKTLIALRALLWALFSGVAVHPFFFFCERAFGGLYYNVTVADTRCSAVSSEPLP